MSTDLARLVTGVAVAVFSSHQADLLPIHTRERLVVCGAETMTLLEACVDLRAVAELARFEADKDRARDVEAHAAQLASLGLQVMRAGGWRAASGAAPADAVSAWASVVALLGRDLTEDRLTRLRRKGAPVAEAVFDLDAKVATLRIDLSALVDHWRAGVVDDPARPDHGWPTVSGCIFGDPSCMPMRRSTAPTAWPRSLRPAPP